MEPKLKAKWLKALRSGKFKKAVGQLQVTQEDVENGDRWGRAGFCCLGVLCEITGTEYSTEDAHLPVELAEQAGLDYNQQRFLVYLNDGSVPDVDSNTMREIAGPRIKFSKRPRSFKQIANIIESRL